MTRQPILAVISIIIAIIYNYNAIIQLSKITLTCSTNPIYSLQTEQKYLLQHTCDHYLLNINATTLHSMTSSATASDSETSGKHPSILKELFRAYQLSSQETIAYRIANIFQIILTKYLTYHNIILALKCNI